MFGLKEPACWSAKTGGVRCDGHLPVVNSDGMAEETLVIGISGASR